MSPGSIMLERTEVKWIRAAVHPEWSLGPALVLLSPMDLQMPSMHVPMVLFFPKAPEDAEWTLEHGLSQVLELYRENCGRLGTDGEGRPCIHLNNEGVPLVLARLSQEMQAYAEQHGNDLEELIPSKDPVGIVHSLPLLVQVTRFACGGVSLGFEGHHQVVDGTGNAQFLMDWASSSRLDRAFVQALTVHERSWMMPRSPPQPSFEHVEYSGMHQQVPKNSLTTLTVPFTRQQLDRLKLECGGQFTTFVSLSAHLWKVLTTKIRKLDAGTKSSFVCPVNGRLELSAPAGFFGNAVFRGFAESLVEVLQERSLGYIASMIHECVKLAKDEDHMRSAVDFLFLRQQKQQQQAAKEDLDLGCSWSIAPNVATISWTGFSLYEVDFGIGAPSRIATTNMNTEGALAIAPSSSSGGLEVFFTIRKEHVRALFESL